MGKLKKARELSLFRRKVILFAVLFVLAVPMAVLIGNNLAGKVAGFDGKPLFDQFELDEEIGESFLQVQEGKEDLIEHIRRMPDFATTTTSTDGIFATTTAD